MVEALLMAVKATNDFEAEMARRFGGGGASEEEPPEVKPHPSPTNSSFRSRLEGLKLSWKSLTRLNCSK